MLNFKFAAPLIILLQIIVIEKTQARPEYAAETHIVNCGVCHVNPYGGGARTIDGKLFGSRDYRAAWMSKYDIFSMDVRMQDYYGQRAPGTNPQSKGFMMMSVLPTANLPIAPEQDAKPMARLVVSYNYAPVGTGFREGYLLMRTSEPDSQSNLSSILVGDFAAPFGLFTDEHRTYTRQMVAMTNRNFESGVMFNGDPTLRFHYDIALTSGFSSAGGVSPVHTDSWGAFFNVRHQILNLPLQVGLSYVAEGTSSPASQPTATSLYGVLSFDRLMTKFKGNIQAEAVYASGFDNANLFAGNDGIAYFIPSTAAVWQSALNNSNSFGFTTLLNWDLSRRWTLQYKYEKFIPDVGFQGDAFYRSGGGFKYFFGSNTSLSVRYDHGDVSRPGLTAADLAQSKGAIGDTYYALLHVWL